MTDGTPVVALIDDHGLLTLGLSAELARIGIDARVAELTPPVDLVAWLGEVSPDAVVLDLGLPYDGGGLSLVAPLVEAGHRVLILTGEDDVELWSRCLEAGAQGVVSKAESLDAIVTEITRVSRAEPVDASHRTVVLKSAAGRRAERERELRPFRDLTARECSVLGGLMEGLSPADVAERDFVSLHTVRTQVKSVLRKLGVGSQIEAVAVAHRSGWRPPASERAG